MMLPGTGAPVRLGDFARMPDSAGAAVQLVSRVSAVRHWLRSEQRWLVLLLLPPLLVARFWAAPVVGSPWPLIAIFTWAILSSGWVKWQEHRWRRQTLDDQVVVLKGSCDQRVRDALEELPGASIPKGHQELIAHLVITTDRGLEVVLEWARSYDRFSTVQSIVATVPTGDHVWHLRATRGGRVVSAELRSSTASVQLHRVTGRIGRLRRR